MPSANLEHPAAPDSSPPVANSAIVRPVVLLLEDDQFCCETMTQLLMHYECEVKVARTLLEAMPILPLVPRFAVLDLMLPDGGGERVLELIRRRKLATKVIVVTGCRERERLCDVARLKPDLILAKPIDFYRLLEFMRANA